MFNICMHSTRNAHEQNQWDYMLSHWQPERLFCMGRTDEFDTVALKKAQSIDSYCELPDWPMILAAPAGGRFLQGATPLTRFVHPQYATYIFGPNNRHVEPQWFGDRTPDYTVYIPTVSSIEMFSFVAAAVMLYDRSVKNG